MSVLFSKVDFEIMEKGAGSEYLEGTAVARIWFGVLAGYCRRNGSGHV
jgi:hypothetical protein